MIYPTNIESPHATSSNLLSILKNEYRLINRNIVSNITQHKIYAPIDADNIRVRYNGEIIGDYYKNKNLLIIYFNCFPVYPNGASLHISCSIIQKALIQSGITIAPKVVSKENLLQMQKQIENENINKFLLVVNKTLDDLNKDRENNIVNINEYNKSLIEFYSNIKIAEAKIISVNNFRSNFKEKFIQNLSQIKELPFVNSVNITNAGIIVDVGDLTMKYNKIEAYIGNFTFLVGVVAAGVMFFIPVYIYNWKPIKEVENIVKKIPPPTPPDFTNKNELKKKSKKITYSVLILFILLIISSDTCGIASTSSPL